MQKSLGSFMEKIKGCLNLLPSQVAHAVSHYVLSVYFTVSIKDVILKRNLFVLFSYVSDLHYILTDKLIGFVHDLRKPFLAKTQPFKLHLFDPWLS